MSAGSVFQYGNVSDRLIEGHWLDVGAVPTRDTPYKSTFFKEYRVRIPAADHGNALVVIVLLYGNVSHRLIEGRRLDGWKCWGRTN
jgi:hypothetical protein